MFYYGWTNYRYLREVPRDAMVIKVTARQWAWSFTYPNGRQTSELYVALGRPVRLDLKSLDVLHGFYVPAFRVKADVVPGKNNYTWFQPEQLGDFDIECTVMCGVNHSYMLSKVHVIPEADFSAWYFGESPMCPCCHRPARRAARSGARGTRLQAEGLRGLPHHRRQQAGGSDLEGTFRQPGHGADRRQRSHLDRRRGLPRALHPIIPLRKS